MKTMETAVLALTSLVPYFRSVRHRRYYYRLAVDPCVPFFLAMMCVFHTSAKLARNWEKFNQRNAKIRHKRNQVCSNLNMPRNGRNVATNKENIQTKNANA